MQAVTFSSAIDTIVELIKRSSKYLIKFCVLELLNKGEKGLVGTYSELENNLIYMRS